MAKSMWDKAGDLITKSVGEDGVKTDIKITLSPETYWYIGLALVLSLIVIIFAYMMIRNNWTMPVSLKQ